MSLKSIGVLVLLALAAPTLWADELFDVRIREDQKGDSFTVQETESTSVKAEFLDAERKTASAIPPELAKKFKSPEHPEETIYRQTVLEKDAEFTKLRRHYESGKIANDEELIEHPLVGKTVIIELRGTERSFYEEDGTELLGKDAEVLEKEFRPTPTDLRIKDWLPKQNVAVGATWPIDVQPFAKIFAELGATRDFQVDLDQHAATGTGTLKRVYHKNGTTYGVIDFKFRIPLNAFIGSKDLPTRPKEKLSALEAILTVDAAIDGTLAAGQSIWKMDFDANVPLSFADFLDPDDEDEDQLIGFLSMVIKVVEHKKWRL